MRFSADLHARSPRIGLHCGRSQKERRESCCAFAGAKESKLPLIVRHLILVFGDQLDLDSAAFDGFDEKEDAVWMAEVAHESTKVWSTKPRIAVFLAAMRHFRDAMRERGWRVCYRELTADSAVWRGVDGRA